MSDTTVPENATGPERVLHRDLLLPCGFLPSVVSDRQPHEQSSRQRPDSASFLNVPVVEEDEAFEVEDEVEYYPPCAVAQDEKRHALVNQEPMTFQREYCSVDVNSCRRSAMDTDPTNHNPPKYQYTEESALKPRRTCV